MLKLRARVLLLTAVCGIVATAALAAQPPAGVMPAEGRAVADVFVHVALVRAELELIRRDMGRPGNTQPEIGVFDAAPREVFFHALTLFRKADRLCFELARQRASVPAPPAGPIEADHVYAVVDAALDRIRVIKTHLGIRETARAPAPDPTNDPTDLLRSTIQANRQLNLLLDRRFSPSEAFQQVTVAVSYGARLLEHFSGAQQVPDPPPFERHKQPIDVYRRLIGCFNLVRDIARASGIPILDLRVRDEEIGQTTPSDVYDIASLVVSELAYLHSRLPQGEPPVDSYYPGQKFPSHVYQRVGILEAQLTELVERVNGSPGWLGSPTAQ